MKIIDLLNEAYKLLANTHPLGIDAAKHAEAMENVRIVANALEETCRKQFERNQETLEQTDANDRNGDDGNGH